MIWDEHDDRSRELKRLRARMADHPYAPIHREIELLRMVLGGVYFPNAQELHVLLDRAANDTEFAVELVQNDHPPIVADQFGDSVQQRLHNYLAAEYSLVQHVHIIANGRAKKMNFGRTTLAQSWAAHKSANPPPVEYAFMKDLRRYTQHMSLPLALPSLSWTRGGPEGPTWTHGIFLDAVELRKWGGEKDWTKDSREFLKDQESVDLLAVSGADFAYTSVMNVWFYNSFATAADPLLAQFNELQAEFEAARMGIRMEEARRVLQERANALSYARPGLTTQPPKADPITEE